MQLELPQSPENQNQAQTYTLDPEKLIYHREYTTLEGQRRSVTIIPTVYCQFGASNYSELKTYEHRLKEYVRSRLRLDHDIDCVVLDSAYLSTFSKKTHHYDLSDNILNGNRQNSFEEGILIDLFPAHKYEDSPYMPIDGDHSRFNNVFYLENKDVSIRQNGVAIARNFSYRMFTIFNFLLLFAAGARSFVGFLEKMMLDTASKYLRELRNDLFIGQIAKTWFSAARQLPKVPSTWAQAFWVYMTQQIARFMPFLFHTQSWFVEIYGEFVLRMPLIAAKVSFYFEMLLTGVISYYLLAVIPWLPPLVITALEYAGIAFCAGQFLILVMDSLPDLVKPYVNLVWPSMFLTPEMTIERAKAFFLSVFSQKHDEFIAKHKQTLTENAVVRHQQSSARLTIATQESFDSLPIIGSPIGEPKTQLLEQSNHNEPTVDSARKMSLSSSQQSVTLTKIDQTIEDLKIQPQKSVVSWWDHAKYQYYFERWTNKILKKAEYDDRTILQIAISQIYPFGKQLVAALQQMTKGESILVKCCQYTDRMLQDILITQPLEQYALTAAMMSPIVYFGFSVVTAPCALFATVIGITAVFRHLQAGVLFNEQLYHDRKNTLNRYMQSLVQYIPRFSLGVSHPYLDPIINVLYGLVIQWPQEVMMRFYRHALNKMYYRIEFVKFSLGLDHCFKNVDQQNFEELQQSQSMIILMPIEYTASGFIETMNRKIDEVVNPPVFPLNANDHIFSLQSAQNILFSAGQTVRTYFERLKIQL